MSHNSVIIDQNIDWKNKTDNLRARTTCGISALRRAREFVDKETLTSIYSAIIQPYVCYFCEVCNILDETQSKRLLKLKNRAARLNMDMSNDVYHQVALNELN